MTEPQDTINVKNEFESLLNLSLQKLKEKCTIKSLKKTVITRLILEEEYPNKIMEIKSIYDSYNEEKINRETSEDEEDIENNTVPEMAITKHTVEKKKSLETIDKKIWNEVDQPKILSDSQFFNLFNYKFQKQCENNLTTKEKEPKMTEKIKMSLNEFPDFHEEEAYLRDWFNVMERIFRIKNVEDEKIKIDVVYAKLATKIVQFKISEESYDKFKEGLLSKFREPPSSKELIQSISRLNFEINPEGIKKLSNLILRAYSNADEETCIARLCDEMDRKIQDKIDAFVIIQARNCVRFNDAVKVLETLEKTTKANNNVKRCYYCQKIGHVEAVCFSKRDGKPRIERYTMGKMEDSAVQKN